MKFRAIISHKLSSREIFYRRNSGRQSSPHRPSVTRRRFNGHARGDAKIKKKRFLFLVIKRNTNETAYPPPSPSVRPSSSHDVITCKNAGGATTICRHDGDGGKKKNRNELVFYNKKPVIFYIVKKKSFPLKQCAF